MRPLSSAEREVRDPPAVEGEASAAGEAGHRARAHRVPKADAVGGTAARTAVGAEPALGQVQRAAVDVEPAHGGAGQQPYGPGRARRPAEEAAGDLHPAGRLQVPQHVRDMSPDRTRADEELRGDLRIGQPAGHHSRSRLVSLINAAAKTLDVEEVELNDSTVVNAIVARAKAGVAVRVVLENPSSYAGQVSAIKSAGGKVVGYSDPNGFYIHAKAMVVDYGLSTQEVEAGSMNISSNSLSNNRELGIILTGTGVAQPVASTIETTSNSDFAGGTAA